MLEHFQAKWIPVRVKKMRYNNVLEVLSDSAESENAPESAFWLSLQVNGKTPSQLLQDTAVFADDQINAGLQITLDNSV
jgi:hypothetical protein